MRRRGLELILLILLLFSFSTGQYGCECVDVTPPSVQIIEPTDGATVSGITTIQALVYDNRGIAKVEFYIDNNKVSETYSSPYYYNWDTDSLVYNSQHTIRVRAYDNAGNIGESPTITVTIGDNLSPIVSITNPQGNTTVSGIVTIQVSVTERNKKAPSGVSKVEFYIDGSKIGEDTTSPYEYNWNTSTVSNGNHIIMVRAYDNAGNIGIASITVNVQNPTSQAKWTFMVFMNGDNNLEYYADLDLNEMKSVGSTNAVNIIVQLDRYYQTGAWRYRVLQNNLQEVWSTTSELDFGSPDTLRDFVNWTITNYPAEKYALVIWDHGAGWRRKILGLRGISFDDSSSTYMTMSQLKYALSQVSRKIDVLGMDACLMAMTEVAYQVKDYAYYLVGSEESEPAQGWPYDTILSVLVSNPSMSPSNLASTIVDKYKNYYSSYSDVTQSAIDLSKISDLKDACNSLALTLKNNMSSYSTQISQAISDTQAYDYSDFRDLYHFAQNIYNKINDATIRNLATNVINKVALAVIAEWHSSDLANSHGISIWLPSSSLYYNYYLSTYQTLDFASSTDWDEFLGALYSTP